MRVNNNNSAGGVPIELCLVRLNAEKSEAIAADVAAFIAAGGQIEQVAQGVMKESPKKTREQINTECFLLNKDEKAGRGRKAVKARRNARALTIKNKKH